MVGRKKIWELWRPRSRNGSGIARDTYGEFRDLKTAPNQVGIKISILCPMPHAILIANSNISNRKSHFFHSY